MVWINSASTPARQHASERAETDGDHEQHGEDHFVNGAAGIHQAANGLVNPPRHQVFGAHQTEGDGENHCQRGAPDGDLQRDGHFGEVILPLAEIGREEVGSEGCHVAAVFNQRKRGHFRALPRDDQHGENNGPAQKREPATLGWGDGDGLHVWLRSVGRIRCLHRIRHQRLHIVGCDAGASYPTYDLLHRFTHRTHRA
ncbi:hypothetical protein BvCmsKSP099_04483 [Escherichia coli]|nr:hypothetical protein BvCmsKSP099_04483 [Escherichia coli]